MRSLLCLIVVASLALPACKTIPAEVQIRAGTTVATGAALAVMRADQATVDKVRRIAQTVADTVDPATGDIDLPLLQREIAAQIVAAFPKLEQATAIANLVNYATALVLGYLRDRQGDAPPSLIYLYIDEAALGVIDGCNLYLPPPVAAAPPGVRLGAQDPVAELLWPPFDGLDLGLRVAPEAVDDLYRARGARSVILTQQGGYIVEVRVVCR